MAKAPKGFPFNNDLIRAFYSANQSFDQEDEYNRLSPHYSEERKRVGVYPARQEWHQTGVIRNATIVRALAEENKVALSLWTSNSPEKFVSQSKFRTAFAERTQAEPNLELLDWAKRYFPKRKSGRSCKLRKVVLGGKEMQVTGLGRTTSMLSVTRSRPKLRAPAVFQPFRFPQASRPVSRSSEVSPRRP